MSRSKPPDDLPGARGADASRRRQPTIPRRAAAPPAWARLAAALCGALPVLGGCSALQTLQVVGLAGQAAMTGAQFAAPARSTGTVHFGASPPREVCIEFNPATQVPDFVPALQAELQGKGVRSRVFERGAAAPQCSAWIRYAALTGWAVPPLEDAYRPYMSNASLYLVDAAGRLLSASHFELQGPLAFGKWSSTRQKLSPVVHSLLTGFESS